MSEIARADFAVEAVPERLDLKLSVLRDADKLLRPGVILASNTSSISVTTLAAATYRPDRFIGMHFMNPGPGDGPRRGDPRAANERRNISQRRWLCANDWRKKPVAVNDAPGFVSNRVLLPMINEAAFAVMEGVATAEGVDSIMKLGMNHPMGPLELADFIGLDTCVHILDVLHEGFGDSKYRACPLLRKMVAAGRLGRKSGQGFYTYPQQPG